MDEPIDQVLAEVLADDTPVTQVTHYRDLDGVRGILAITIACYHYGINVMFDKLTRGWLHDPAWALVVDFFFILSGYVLCRSYRLRPRGIGQRVIERVFRLMPVHLFILGLMVPLYFVGRNSLDVFTVAAADGVVGRIADFAGIIAFLGLHSWNGPSWSMNVELVLPVILAAGVPFLWRVRTPILLTVLFVLASIEGYFGWQIALGVDGFQIARGACGLAMGGIVFVMIDRQVVTPPHTRWWLPAMTGLMLALMALASPYPLLALATPFVAIATVAMGTRSQGLFGTGAFRWIGDHSFTIYMVHQPLKVAVYLLLGVTAFNGALGIKVALIVGVFVCAAALTRYVEQPFMRLGKRLLKDRQERISGLLPTG